LIRGELSQQEIIQCCMRSPLCIAHCSTLQRTTGRKKDFFGLMRFRPIEGAVRRRQNAYVADHIGVGKV